MNTFDPILKDSLPKTQIEQMQQRQHELVLIKREPIVPGHTLFSYNTESHEIKKAPIQYCRDVDFMTKEPLHRPKIVIEPHCVYRQALNKKNFIKRLKREGIILN